MTAIVVFACPKAHAAEPARLQVTREEGAEECPDEKTLRDAVAARVGYEPFTPDARRQVVVVFRRDGAGLRGTVQLREADDSVRGARTLTSTRGDCEELASVTTLTITILLDPRSGLIPPKPPEPEPLPDTPPKAPPTADRAVTTPPAEASHEPLRWRMSTSAMVSVGTAPAPAAGLLVGLGVERRSWSMAGEFRADLPASDSIGGLGVRTTYTAGNLVPCARLSTVYGCGVLSIGAIQGELVGASPSRQATLHMMIGPRVGLSVPIVRWLALDAHLDGSYALTRTVLSAGSVDLWATPTVSAGAAVGFLGRFP